MFSWLWYYSFFWIFFFQAEDGIRHKLVTGVQTCALPIAVEQQDFRVDVRVKFGEFSNECVEAEKSECRRDLYLDRAGQSPYSLAQFGQGLIVRGNCSDDPLQMVLSVGAQDNLASRPVKQRLAHDPL